MKAASYLSTCFLSTFNSENGEEDLLGETLKGSTFERLVLFYSPIPAWQVDDKRLEWLRLRRCNDIHIFPDIRDPEPGAEFKATEEGILSYCFTQDHDLPVPEKRTLRFTWASITPAFFQKVVEASKNSRFKCDVELRLEYPRSDVGNLDLGVLPEHREEYDRFAWADVQMVRYDIADHGNGIRLLVRFKSEDGVTWKVLVRHGKKEHEEFFVPTPVEPEWSEEYWENPSFLW